MNVTELDGKTIAFAASGGLDSCTITHWLTQNGVRVVCFTADLAQPDEPDFNAIGERMRACGATDYVAVPLQHEIAAAGVAGVQAQVLYEGRYWNTTGIAREVTTRGLLPEVIKRGIDILAHGCTGRGNDQVRFQLISNMLHPQIQVYAPWRDQAFLDRFGGRAQMIEYCEQHSLPIKATREKPYSTDANLLGLTHEAGKLERLDTPARFVAPEMGVWPEQAPDQSEQVTIEFEQGRPVRVNGQAVDDLAAFKRANEIAGRHGVGIGTHVVENRFVGVKSRGVYEAPGMELIGTCYGFLLQLILDRRARELFDICSATVAKQIYQGYPHDLASRMLRTAVAEVSALATGSITVRVYKGTIAYENAAGVPHSLYSHDSSMEREGSFDHADAEGFVRVLAVHARAVAGAGQADAGGDGRRQGRERKKREG
jgi:argininosuccinate synthase